MLPLLWGPDDRCNPSRCQTLLCGKVQGLGWEASPRFPFHNFVTSFPYIHCALCQAWTSEGQLHPPVNLRTVLLDNAARKNTTSSHTVCLPALGWYHSSGNQKLTHLSQEQNFCTCLRGSHTCLLGRATWSIIRFLSSFPHIHSL